MRHTEKLTAPSFPITLLDYSMLVASAELVSLCRSQLLLLAKSMGASLSIVYLAQDLLEGHQPSLMPIATHPESAIESNVAALSAGSERTVSSEPLAYASQAAPLLPTSLASVGSLPMQSDEALDAAYSHLEQLPPSYCRLVLPLMHQEVLLGVLVTVRNNRPWNGWEREQVEHVASTLANACLLDRRCQWLHQEQQATSAQRQRDLIDNLLHQFRNSLTALRTFSKLVYKRLQPGDPSQEVAASIIRETSRLQELAQQLEQAVEAEQANATVRSLPEATSETNVAENLPGRTTPPRLLPAAGLTEGDLVLEPCSVSAILEPLLASAQTIAQERNQTIHTDILPDLPPAAANPQALREILNNLIENALKYTPAGGHILIAAKTTDSQQLQIQVSDTGPGIPIQDLNHLFERYYRGVQAETDIPGTGLGLAIARSLTTQMHGHIRVSSPAVASLLQNAQVTAEFSQQPGATFTVELALAFPIKD